MTDVVRLAARVTAHAIRIRQLEDDLCAERARNDQLSAELSTLRVLAIDTRNELRKRSETHAKLKATIESLRGRLGHARRSRDMWKARATR